jgi:hypothetical protein
MGKMNLGSGTSSKQHEQGTVKPYPNFSAERDCEILRKAMKGFGTDEKAIIEVLGKRTASQRLEIRKLFKTMSGKDLVKELKSELGGEFEDMAIALLQAADEYDAQELRAAVQGIGTNEETLIEILCTRTNAQITAAREAYKRLYKRDLEKDLSSETSGHFKRLMVALVNAGRQENMAPDPAKAKTQAQELYQAGVKKLGTDESKFNMILCSQSYEQLRLVFEEYHRSTNKSLETAIKNEMSGDLEGGMLAIVKCIQNRANYFAEKLYKSMKGMGTKDQALIRIMVTRCEVDMVQIKQEFQKMYGKTLESFIADDTSGDYKKMLIALAIGN